MNTLRILLWSAICCLTALFVVFVLLSRVEGQEAPSAPEVAPAPAQQTQWHYLGEAPFAPKPPGFFTVGSLGRAPPAPYRTPDAHKQVVPAAGTRHVRRGAGGRERQPQPPAEPADARARGAVHRRFRPASRDHVFALPERPLPVPRHRRRGGQLRHRPPPVRRGEESIPIMTRTGIILVSAGVVVGVPALCFAAFVGYLRLVFKTLGRGSF